MNKRILDNQEPLTELEILREDYRQAVQTLCLNESRLEALLLLSKMTEEPEETIIRFALEEGVRLTDSPIGHLTFIHENGAVTQYGWTGKRLPKKEFTLNDVGMWSDCFSERRAIIHNTPELLRLPPGHIPLQRYLGVPVFEDEQIALVAGVGNKENDYNKSDIRQLTLLMDGMWKTLCARRQRLEREQIEILKASERLKEEILSIVSHELRTPLNAIMGFASLLEDEEMGPLEARQKEMVGKILHHSEVMEHLVEDLLDLAQIKAGRFHVFPTCTAYPPLVEEVIQGLQPLLERKQLSLTIQVDIQRLPILDRHRIGQVLNNLLSNAIKFTPNEGTIGFRVFERDAELVTEISDSGIGIAPADLPNLFQPFHQLDMSLTRKVGGTGLGLSISRGILEAHGGRIEAESPGSGKGTTFRFYLPLPH